MQNKLISTNDKKILPVRKSGKDEIKLHWFIKSNPLSYLPVPMANPTSLCVLSVREKSEPLLRKLNQWFYAAVNHTIITYFIILSHKGLFRDN